MKSNKCDQQTIQEFEQDWKNNLYRAWNRMSSGSYFPPPVQGHKLDRKMLELLRSN